MDFRVLGPVQLWSGEREVDLGASKQRCVLAVLLLDPGRSQPVESLIDRVWGEDPPAQVRSALYSYISRIRGALRTVGAEVELRQKSGGYQLIVPADRVDLHRFVEITRRARAAEDTDERVGLLREAVDLWGGVPLQDLSGRWPEEVRQRLLRQRVRVCAEWGRDMIGLGRHAEAGDVLEHELAESPLAEPLAGQLMICLQAQGRQAEALVRYATLRERLADELGVEPGPALQELHLRILRTERLGGAPVPGQPWPKPPVEPPPSLPPAGRPAPRPAAGDLGDRPPYRGLETFQQDDAAWFFGRRAMVDELLESLAHQRFLAVFGPSGSGKSSLLRAGLIACVGTGAAPGFDGWSPVLLTPGEHPLKALAVRLAAWVDGSAMALHRDLASDPSALGTLVRRAADGDAAGILLVVDQFEELFTLCGEEYERAQFVEALLSVVDNVSVPARLVLGVRADFYAACADFPALVALLRDQQLLVGPMAEQDLRAVIVEPAVRAGLAVEPALADTVLADVLGQPAALPLVSHAMLETWRRCEGGLLTVGHYQRTGGVRGAVAQTAEDVYASFGPARRRTVREVFLRLTVPGEGPEDTRRRARRSELLDRDDADEVSSVLAELAAARLITLDEETVTVAHECLIRGWPRLRDWIDDDRASLRAHRRLTESALEWEAHERDESLLYRGPRLAYWQERDTGSLNDLERAFRDASVRAQERERRARRKRVRIAFAGLSAAVVVLLVLATIALVKSDEAEQRRNQALAGSLVAGSREQLPLDPELSLLLARRAYGIQPGPQAEAALAQALCKSRIRGTLTGHDGTVTTVDFAADGRLVSGGADGTVRVWPSGEPAPGTVLARELGRVRSVSVSPDGTRVVATGGDGVVRVLRMDNQAEPVLLRGNENGVSDTVFSLDGRQVLSIGEDGAVRIWPVDGGEPAIFPGPRGGLIAAAVSPDRHRFAGSAADGSAWVWEQGGPFRTAQAAGQSPVETLTFRPDGQAVAGGRADGRDHVWRVADGTRIAEFYRNRDRVLAVAYSADGQYLLSGGQDRTTHVLRADGRTDFITLRGQGGPIRDVAFTPDDRLAVTAGDDGTIRLWEPMPRPELNVQEGRVDRSNSSVTDTAFSPDGKLVASSGLDGTVLVHTADGAGAPVLLRGHQGPVEGVAFSPDGKYVAGAGRDGAVLVWHAGGGLVRTFIGSQGAVWAVAFSHDGKLLLGAGADGTVRRWPLDGGPPSMLTAGTAAVRDIATSGDGSTALAVEDGTVQVWPAAEPDRPHVLRGMDGMRTVAITADGGHVAGAGNDGTVRVWRIADGTQVAELSGHYGLVYGVAFSPDGRYLASVGNDKHLRLWNWASWRDPILFDDYNSPLQSVALGADGLVAVGRGPGHNTVDVWRCDVCLPPKRMPELAARADQRANRELRNTERQRYLDEPG
ncbi:BTAD domain-containing putative transcriptional regulator [Amycolatopsis sp. lyj-108]|uniref:nSTAND1 domain-containing NTPase n=1 Tax=Amycolatopsis sp. lyj-108 TaxID=2789286 RepID=UPI00397DFCDF